MVEIQVACKALVVTGGKALLLKRGEKDTGHPGVWEFPGGRLERGETPQEGLKREILEETGLEVEVLNPLRVRQVNAGKNELVMLSFLCRPLNREVRLSDEHSAYEWLPIREAKRRVFEPFLGDIEVFERYFSADWKD